MGERYYITGVQLGMMKVFNKKKETTKLNKIIDDIIKRQFIGDAETLKEMLSPPKKEEKKPGFIVTFKKNISSQEKRKLMEDVLKNKIVQQIEGSISLHDKRKKQQ